VLIELTKVIPNTQKIRATSLIPTFSRHSFRPILTIQQIEGDQKREKEGEEEKEQEEGDQKREKEGEEDDQREDQREDQT